MVEIATLKEIQQLLLEAPVPEDAIAVSDEDWCQDLSYRIGQLDDRDREHED